jgi:hypothetical protein
MQSAYFGETQATSATSSGVGSLLTWQTVRMFQNRTSFGPSFFVPIAERAGLGQHDTSPPGFLLDLAERRIDGALVSPEMPLWQAPLVSAKLTRVPGPPHHCNPPKRKEPLPPPEDPSGPPP